MSRKLVATLIAAAALGAGASTAQAQIVSPPLGATLGYLPTTDQTKGKRVKFWNLDIVAHDVRSVVPGLFGSPIIALGRAGIARTELLARGSYQFYCTLHAGSMRGVLRIK